MAGKTKAIVPSITVADALEYLNSADDFALEREVFSIAKSWKFKTEHAGLYTDPVTAKPRQFDVRASFSHKGQRISLAIECKSLQPDFPLLVSCVPRELDECVHEFLNTDSVQGNGGSFTRVQKRSKPDLPSLYWKDELVGKSMRQIRREPANSKNPSRMVAGGDLFDKWMQALGSLGEMIEAGARELSTRTASVKRIAFLPVLVVPDQTLWAAGYAAHGSLLKDSPQICSSITFFLGRTYQLKHEALPFTVSHLHIITRAEIGTWLGGIANGGGIWEELFN